MMSESTKTSDPSQETKVLAKKKVKKDGSAKSPKSTAAKKKTTAKKAAPVKDRAPVAKKTGKKTATPKKESATKKVSQNPKVVANNIPLCSKPICTTPIYKKFAVGTLIGGAIGTFTAAAVQLWKRLKTPR
jgi:hypothetical protein